MDRLVFAPQPGQDFRLSFTIDEARRATGFTRTRLYDAIAKGELRTFTHGRRRFVSFEALRNWISAMERRG